MRAPSFPLSRERSGITLQASVVVRRDIRGAALARVANSSLDSNCLGKYDGVEVAN
jgi:hypothetical protein